MPRLMDQDGRRRALSEAVWRVVERAGLQGATVRAVAAEAGVSAGSLRYTFPTQSELLLFAMRLVADRAGARMGRLGPGLTRPEVEHALQQVLPMDAERRLEADVWLAFVARAQVDPALRELGDQHAGELEAFCTACVAALDGSARSPAQLAAAGLALSSFVDGLALHGVTRPATMTPTRQRQLLAAHLDQLG